MSNPFTYNLPVDKEMFFGRQDELDFVNDQLTSNPGDSIALIAGRRMGKTSFLEALLRKFSEDKVQELFIVPIYIDLSGEILSSILEFYEIVAHEMISEIGKYFPAIPAKQTFDLADSPAKE